MKHRHLMLTCKEAAQEISKAQDGRLSVRERLMLAMHLLFCASCRQYQRQVHWLAEVSRTLLARWSDQRLGEDFKQRLRERLHRCDATGEVIDPLTSSPDGETGGNRKDADSRSPR
ncbi:zf-HC2 domain-containing protein [Acidithiobacillus caldus]|nr:zf-HC2 domain-containing protein [Acidithiobacillus caldus]MBU2791203.1 zf-HC2 domain-containing protein [Acidithiobacillus caldus]MBU2821004.1 zf-HC2 domain-containing protein [Acidithiobacillus caldus]